MENNIEIEKTEVTGIEVDPDQKPAEKLFTQEQVNEIIKKRLKNQKNIDSSMQEVNAKVADLEARENRLSCREYLLQEGYPAELLEIIDTSDVEAFKKKADRASGVFSSRQQEVAPLASLEPSPYAGINAFENKKRKPKQYLPGDM